MSNSNQDESAARLFEATYFAPGTMYGSRQDYYRDLKMERYRTDSAFRTLVDRKLEFSVRNNPNFDVPKQPSRQPVNVKMHADKDGTTYHQVSRGSDVGTTRDPQAAPAPKVDAPPHQVIRDAFGRVTASVRQPAKDPAPAPNRTGVQTSPAGGIFELTD